jgi:hypothetical protein
MAKPGDDPKAQLQRLQGRMTALSEVMDVLRDESAKVAAFDAADEDAPLEDQVASGRELVALSVQAVRACALKVNQLFEEARGEFEQITAALPGGGSTRH